MKVADIASCEIKSLRLKTTFFNCFKSCHSTSDSSISYLNSEVFGFHPKNNLKGLIITNTDDVATLDSLPENVSYVIVDEPKYFFAALFYFYHKNFNEDFLIAYSLQTHPNVHVSAKISSGARIGRNVQIGSNCVIHEGVSIYDNVVLGNNVFIKQNTVIGGYGYGYAVRIGKPPLRIPHLGGVRIGDNVDIGSSVSIDRGTFGETDIGENVKIDNSVHVAHNVRIGARSLIIANSEISGGVEIGMDVWIAPNVSIREKIVIGDRAIVGLGSVVTKDVISDTTVMGVPAKVFRNFT